MEIWLREARLKRVWLWVFVIAVFGQASATAQVMPPYRSRIGVAVEKSDHVCLSIHNPHLAKGSPVRLVIVSDPQSVVESAVVRKAGDSCPQIDQSEGQLDVYELRIGRGALNPMEPAIAVAGSAGSITAHEGEVTANLDGKIDYFHSCTSQEGVHLTVWSGNPRVGQRLWHQYYSLGYDVDPTCTPRDTTAN